MNNNAVITTRAKFWSDDYDMDLLKTFPKLEQLLATVERPLYAHGGESFGRLNHPSVWNSNGGLVAFFSFNPNIPNKPASYWTKEPPRECTWTEAVRDWWPHHYLLTLDGKALLPSDLWPEFQTLMYALRGWDKTKPEKTLNAVRQKVEDVILEATLEAERLAERS